MYWEIFLLSGLGHLIFIFLNEILLNLCYSFETKKRLTFALDELSSSVITVIYGVQMFYNSELLVPGIWEMMMLPSHIISTIYIAANKKHFNSGFYNFIMTHHLFIMIALILLITVDLSGTFEIIQLVPYLLVWNGSTIPWFIDFSWELYREPNFTIKLGSMIIQRIWRTSLFLIMVINKPDYLFSIIMFLVGASIFEVYDIAYQVRSLVKIKTKII